ncbi:MAG: SusC/RagA family TonB-linked outer membrane protein, partial [Bacteroidales bacterium]|nr:SusC/RagA family TonB-linked outer membrane protein [Bacteroidales bacterium]
MKRQSIFKLMTMLAAVLLLAPAAWAQRTVSGVVRDASGSGVIGAGVVVQGTTNGSITASDGSFTLRNVSEGATLEVTCLGYKSQVVSASNGMTIVLAEDNETLDETIVVAYGTTKKASFSGSASVVKSDQLDRLNGEGFSSALQGMSAGVQVSNFAANPGSEARILIRGISSMSGKSAPLYVVDGMPYDGGLNSINPSDIESLTVLKDAAASSLYGSRAANGVIIITTKKGASAGKAKVNFRAAWGTSDSSVPNPKTMADPKETLLLNWEAYYNDHRYNEGNDPKTAGDLASAEIVGRKLRMVTNSSGGSNYVSPFKNGIPADQWVLHDGNGHPSINPALEYAWEPSDWDVYGAIFSRKLRQDYGLDVSGASDSGKTNYYVSAGFIDDGGYMLNQYYKRYSFRANVNSQVNDWLQLGGSVAYSYWRQNFTGSNRAHIYYSTLQSPWLRNSDNTDWVYSEKTGKRMYDYGTNFTGFFGIHPVNGLGDYWNNDNDEYFNSSDGHSITARYFAELSLPFDIKFRSSVNLDTNLSMGYYYGSAVHGSGQKAPYGLTVSDGGGDAQRSWDQLMSLTWNNILNWGHQFGDHRLDLMAGQEAYSYSDNSGYAYGAGIMQINQYELNNTSREWEAGSARDKYALLSFLGKIDYNFANKYYLSASFRRDGSSRFHPDNRWGNFFSVGASWRITNEEFMKNVSWLDNMVIRASYGTTGNDKLIVRQSNGRP